MLMYRGSPESYPCRSDLLCFLKREYQLIGQEDFQKLKTIMSFDSENKAPKKAFRRKNLYEIYPMKGRPRSNRAADDELWYWFEYDFLVLVI